MNKQHSIVVSQFTQDVNAGATKESLTDKMKVFRSPINEGIEWANEQKTAEEIANLVVSGHYFVPAHVKNGSQKRENFSHSSIIVLDFDNGESPEYIIDLLKGINIEPTIVYSSVSDTPFFRKFRVMSFLTEKIVGADKYEDVLHGIFYELWTSYGIKPDIKTMDATHAYFPGRELIHFDAEAITYKMDAYKLMKDKAEVKAELKEFFKEVQETEAEEKGFTVREAKKDKAKTHTTENEMANAILKEDVEKCREYTGYPLEVNGWDAMSREEKMKALPITNLFNIKLQEKFQCWLPEHQDNEASANIYVGRDGQELYHCYGCGRTHQLHSLIADMTGKNTRETARFLKEITGLEWLSNYQVNAMIEAKNLEQIVIDANFGEMYPKLAMYLERSNMTSFYLFLINQASLSVLDESISKGDSITFFMSVSEIQRRMELYGIGGRDVKAIRKKLKNLAKRGLIINEEEMDEQFLNRARYIRRQKGVRYHVNFYTVNIGHNVFAEAERLTIELKEKGDRNGYTSKKQTIATMGEATAKSLYPQDDFSTMKYIRTRDIFISLTQKIVDKKGYATPTDIVSAFEKKMKGKVNEKDCQSTFERYRGFLTNGEHFKGVRVNKKRREMFNIVQDVASNSLIFIDKEVV